MREISQRQPVRLLAVMGAGVFATALFAGWVGSGIGGETTVTWFDDLATVLAALTATALCVRAAKRHERELRPFWWLLAGACGAWTLAEAIWAVYDLALEVSVPVPSWADVGYLGAIPLAVAALLFHPAMHASGTEKARSVLDGLISATALLFLSWTLVLGPLWRNTDLTTLGGVVALAYPFGDIVIIFFIVLAMHGMTGGGRLALWCLLAGLLALALSDSVYSYLTGVTSYEGGLIDTGWFAGYLGIALGAYCAGAGDDLVRTPRRSVPATTSLAAPFLPVLCALSVIAIKIQLGDRLDTVAWISAFALVALVLARQGLLVLDLVTPNKERDALVAKRLAHAALGHPATPATGPGAAGSVDLEGASQ